MTTNVSPFFFNSIKNLYVKNETPLIPFLNPVYDLFANSPVNICSTSAKTGGEHLWIFFMSYYRIPNWIEVSALVEGFHNNNHFLAIHSSSLVCLSLLIKWMLPLITDLWLAEIGYLHAICSHVALLLKSNPSFIHDNSDLVTFCRTLFTLPLFLIHQCSSSAWY